MTLRDIPITTIRGEQTTFGALAGDRLVLVVNVASRCGLAPQYEQLEDLQKQYGARGFTVIGFPSNQFLQELSSEQAVQEYCSTTWGVTFPMTEKVRLNGKKAHELYKQLTETPDIDGETGKITWNFEKFLVAPDGRTKRFSPRVKPDAPEVIEKIEAWLPDAA